MSMRQEGKSHKAPVLRVVPPVRESVPPEVDPRDLDALYRRFSPYVAAVAIRLLGRDHEIDDLVQDVFLNALRGISQLRDAHAIKAWLARVTVRLSVRRLRKRRLLAVLQLGAASGDYEQLASPDTSSEQKALLAAVYSVLDRMPARTRVIWLLRHVLDESLQSIAELTACSQSTVQRRLRDAESLLAEELPHA
ncbi:MAG TPA: sigma-70 family RNA polymerase sigma factor [Polyangiales bacterium]|nr:sigma-70 family RNA polymerase sigma factor [Polyangiales bacterium]